MPNKRNYPSNNSLSPGDATPPQPFPRSASPSGSFTQFLTRPSKWFSRSSSAPRIPSNTEPRPSFSSTSSSSRKVKISRPTDPRPILENYTIGASKSVVDLSSSSRPPGSLDIPHSHYPPVGSNDLGDLRNISRKGWSRSADDLSKMSPKSIQPINTALHEKIHQYRGRSDSNASGVSPSTPTSPASIRHPFPSAVGHSPVSASSPRSSSGTNGGVTISISAPNMEAESPISPNQQFHNRSHSFTPRLPSKLSTPNRYPQVGSPVTPKRKGSAPEYDPTPPLPIRKASLNSEVDGGEPSSAPATRTGFLFSQNTHHTLRQTQHPQDSIALLEPSPIIEASDRDKRVSQIIYHSGFINKMSDVPSNLNSHVSIQKGWKPFKMELKGSKLYFFKPPNDKNAGIRDLFPTELVPTITEAESTQAEKEDPFAAVDFGKGARPIATREDSQVSQPRRRRAYWGRTTHPSLVCVDGSVVRGNLEALTHEAVFGTTFDLATEIDRWRQFASTVLLSLPQLAGFQRFEAELLRYLGYLVSGAAEEEKAEVQLRTSWITSEFHKFYEARVNTSDWESWKAQLTPQPPPPTQDAESAIAAVDDDSPPVKSADLISPNIDTFSPRPPGGGMGSFMDALSEHSLQLPPFSVTAEHPTTPKEEQPTPRRINSSYSPPWNQLESGGLSREVMMSIDSHFMADSLMLYHRSQLEQVADEVTPSDVLEMHRSSREDPLSSFVGSDEQPHWLTKMLLLQILAGDAAGKNYSVDDSRPPAAQTSRTHARSEMISVWAKVGELCRQQGDDCTWQAIKAALCSRPIARLDKVWKRVDPRSYAAVETWSGDASSRTEFKMTPWMGTVRDDMQRCFSESKELEGEEAWNLEPLHRAHKIFGNLWETWSQCSQTIPEESVTGEHMKKMINFWRDRANERGGVGSLAQKFDSVNNFMSLSLAAEQRRQGIYEPFFWHKGAPASSAPSNSALIPLFFIEALPSVMFLDRPMLLRGRCDSDTPEGQLLPTINQPLYGFQDSPSVSFHRRSYLGDNSPLTGGTVIPAYNGQLLLVVQSNSDTSKPDSRPNSRPSSRPPSSNGEHGIAEKPLGRQTSIRVKPGSSQVLDRKTSVSKRNSLPLLSQRSNLLVSESSVAPSLRVQVQAGSLGALVNILVFGLQNMSVSVADDNGEISLRDNKTRDLTLDRMEYEKLWWLVFRSFITPMVFFELLRKLYVTCKTDGFSLPILEGSNIAIIRCHVLDTMKSWLTVGGGAQDALDEPALYDALQAFISNACDHVIPSSAQDEEGIIPEELDSLNEARHSLSRVFRAQTMRPAHRSLASGSVSSMTDSRMRSMSTRDVPDIDHCDVEDLLDNLDGMIYAAFNNISQEDYFITIDLLEVQAVEKTSWFSPKESTFTEDTVEVQTMHSHLLEVPPSGLLPDSEHESVYRLLPPGIRSSIRAYTIIRKWLISKIVALNIGLRTRQDRMEKFLRALEIARLRSSPESQRTVDLHRASVRSGVEAVVTSAILSVESRIHQRAWQNVALARGVPCDSISSYLSKPNVVSTRSRVPFTVDLGWIFERLLEIISAPDLLDPASPDGQNLVNLDKRRHLSTLVSNTTSVFSNTGHGPHKEQVIRRGFERLNIIEKDVSNLRFELRSIKDEAQREALSAPVIPAASARKIGRPFQKLLSAQIEKNKRDKTLRARLLKEKTLEQSRLDKREEVMNRAMRPRKATATGNRQHRNKKSMSSAILHFMRPISTAFGADVSSSPGVRRTAEELDFDPSGKPSLVLSLAHARVAQFINNERSFVLLLDTEEGGHYLLQALNQLELRKWLEHIERVSKMAAQRRLTYLGTPQPQVSDHLHQPSETTHGPLAVFGVELEVLLQREAGDRDPLVGAVPNVVSQCLEEIEKRGLREVGIYRIAGANSEINHLKDGFNRGEVPFTESTDINAICDVVKSWFRVLPGSVFPPVSYYAVIEAMKLESLDARLNEIRTVVQSLPQMNYDLLKRICEHLEHVNDFEEQNNMTADALAIVFSPNLLRAPRNDFQMILANMGHTHKLVHALITHFNVIFDESEAEGELEHGDDEMDSPIVEEDEPEEDARS